MEFKKASEEVLEKVLFDPYVYAYFCSDYSPIYEQALPSDYEDYDWYCNLEETILFLVKEGYPGVFEVHTAALKGSRGREVFKAYRGFKKYIKDVLGGLKLILTIPSDNRPAQVAAVQAAGAKRILVLKNAVAKHRFFHDMYIYEVEL